MVRLREIPRTATFAWSPGAAPPLIATGTRAGAVDADFSNETQLEIWDLGLDNPEQSVELHPVGSISADSRFHDIAWSEPNDDHPRGIIAGALESGSLDLWDAEKLRTGASDSHIHHSEKHSGAVKSLQFNPFKHEALASAGAKGELYITNVNDLANPFRLGSSAARADDFESVDWNKKVAHILATGSSGGFVTVWDVRSKKENMTLNNMGRKAVSAVAWDPDMNTRLITAVPNDQDPLILVWDLRNANAPERVLKGHDQGVLSLSWCTQDSDILLSCGKDNRTICWNPRTGENYGEFPVVTNWTFQTRFSPHNPGLLATASFDGKIAIHTLQNTGAAAQPAAAPQAPDSEDFFSRAQTEPQGVSFSLPRPPKWMQRPVGASFGFGGKLVKFAPAEPGSKKSKITITNVPVDSEISSATEEFEKALESGDITTICESKIEKAKSEEEKADWTVIETLIAGNPRAKLVEYLGFAEKNEAAAEKEPSAESTEAKEKEATDFFDDGAEDNFLSDLAATKGAKTNNPFQIYTGSESESDKDITKALLLGKFEKALEICLKEERLSDAFMIAICGGQKCIEKAQSAYFKRKGDGPNYLRVLASVVGKNLWDVVYNADLKDWKEVMATICTYADQADFPDLCEALGDRLEEAISEGADAGTLRKDASFCYLAGSKLEKVVVNWAQELQENENAGLKQDQNDNSFSIHARALQDFIEKVTVFRQVTGFEDADRNKDSDWKLAPLYAKYVEYADIAAAHGQLKIAERYLDLLPEKYPAADLARNRVKQATKKAAPQTQHKTAAAQRASRVVPTYAPVQPTAPTQPTTASPYAPANPIVPATQTPSPYAPAGATRNAYTPAGYQPPQPAGIPGIPTPQPFGGYQPQQQHTIPPPPQNFGSSSSVTPAARNNNIPNWNDLPDFGPKPTSRRATPSVSANAITSPFPNAQPSIMSPPPTGMPSAFGQPPRATPPPPPRGPPRVSSPATSQTAQSENRPPSTSAYAPPQQPASNPYAPPQATGFVAPPTAPVARGPSPYNPPPAAAPPSNRYAPTPSPQPPAPAPGIAPPPRQVAPPPNPYGPQQFGQTISTPSPVAPAVQPPQGPPQGFSRPPPQGPPQAPPRAGPPQGPAHAAGASISRPDTAQSQRSVPAAPSKYPPGDRSHIPEASRPIYEILNADMQRVKSKAPAAFKVQVLDTERRLNILFDHLNNEDLLKPDTIQEMNELAQHLQTRQYEQAQALFTDLMTNKTEEGANWMVGVKRLIQMSRATP